MLFPEHELEISSNGGTFPSRVSAFYFSRPGEEKRKFGGEENGGDVKSYWKAPRLGIDSLPLEPPSFQISPGPPSVLFRIPLHP